MAYLFMVDERDPLFYGTGPRTGRDVYFTGRISNMSVENFFDVKSFLTTWLVQRCKNGAAAFFILGDIPIYVF
jgi:hypothetical protein